MREGLWQPCLYIFTTMSGAAGGASTSGKASGKVSDESKYSHLNAILSPSEIHLLTLGIVRSKAVQVIKLKTAFLHVLLLHYVSSIVWRLFIVCTIFDSRCATSISLRNLWNSVYGNFPRLETGCTWVLLIIYKKTNYHADSVSANEHKG